MYDFFGIIPLSKKNSFISRQNQIKRKYIQDKNSDEIAYIENDEFIALSSNYSSKREITFSKYCSQIKTYFNGYARLDNKKDLCDELGCNLNETDYAFIRKGFIKWGELLPKKLVGAFSFVVFNPTENYFMCFRDHMGMKPFYYFYNNDFFIYGSKIKFILENVDSEIKLNRNRVIDYLLFVHPKQGETFYRSLHKLPKGHLLIYKKNKINKLKYFDLKINPYNQNSDEIINKFSNLFNEVVDSIINTDGEDFGIALSGGLDSSALLGISDNIIKDKKIYSKSAIFENLSNDDYQKVDEKIFMEEAVKDRNHVQHEYIKFSNTGAFSSLESIEEIFDEPISAINAYIFQNFFKSLKKNKVNIFIDGIDGDTVISDGYELFSELGKKFKFIQLYKTGRDYASLRGYKKPGILSLIKNHIIKNILPDRAYWFFAKKKKLHPYMMMKLLNVNHLKNDKDLYNKIVNHYGRFSLKRTGNAFIDHKILMNAENWENDLEDLDYLATYYGIDHRSPYFDKRLMAFCLNVPVNLKLRNGINRFYFRESMKNFIPDLIRMRLTKSDLSPGNNNDLLNFDIDILKNELLQDSPIENLVNSLEINNLINRIEGKNLVYGETMIVFLLFSLSRWMRKNKFKW